MRSPITHKLSKTKLLLLDTRLTALNPGANKLGTYSNEPIAVERLGRPFEDARSVYLVTTGAELRAWDVSNKRQYRIDGNHFVPAPDVLCPGFEAYGYTFTVNSASGRLKACKATSCEFISIKPRTRPFAYAAAYGGVFVGTSHGDALLFRGGKWCRMKRENDIYFCPPERLPVVTEPSNQFYSSVVFQGRTLLGEYPTGRVFQFDGGKVFPSELTPPPYASGAPTASESQSMAVYCGDLYIGYWPYGDLWRYHQGKWQEPLRLFSAPPREEGVFPYEDQARNDGVVFNFYGQRVSSLVSHEGSLYVSTSNKGAWHQDLSSSLTPDEQRDYGVVYRITQPGCRATTREAQ